MISFKVTGSTKNLSRFLAQAEKLDARAVLQRAGQQGVAALIASTPKESGLAASSWSYSVSGGKGGARITWTNSNNEGGHPVAVMLQYGHGTGTGGYVQGRDYINPAMRPVFDQISQDVRKAVM